MLLSGGAACCLKSLLVVYLWLKMRTSPWQIGLQIQQVLAHSLKPVAASLFWNLSPAQPGWAVWHCGQPYRGWKCNGFRLVGKQVLPGSLRNSKGARWCLSSRDGHLCSLLPNQLWIQRRNRFYTKILFFSPLFFEMWMKKAYESLSWSLKLWVVPLLPSFAHLVWLSSNPV